MTIARTFARACIAAACTSAAANAAGENNEGDDRWRDFPVFVWFHGGPSPSRASFEVLQRHGLAGCNVEASDSSDVAAKSGLGFYVDHLAGKGDLYLRPPVFDADRERLKQDPLGFMPSRPSVLDDLGVMTRLLKLVDEGVARHRMNRPLCYVLDDELSVTRGVNPMDYCFAPQSLAAFRAWLKHEHGTIERLNSAWGSRFRQFDDVIPPTTGQARKNADGFPLSAVNFAGWRDHRAFMDGALARSVGELARRARALDAAAPIGFTGGEFPSAFGGFDWWPLLEEVTLVEAYEGGLAPELVHSFARPGTKVISTLFVPDGDGSKAWTPRDLWPRVARGDDGAVIWSSGAIFDASGKDLNAAGRSVAAAIATTRALRRALGDAKPAAPMVWIVSSADSVRAAWMLDSWQDGATWPNRLTSYEADHSSSAASREGWAATLTALGVPYGFVDTRDPRWIDSARPALTRLGARVVVLPEIVALADDDVRRLEEFVASGGILIADAHALLFDEHLRGRDGSALARLFGVRRPDALAFGDAAAGFVDDPARDGPFGLARGEPAGLAPSDGTERTQLGFVRSNGKGATLYLDLRLEGVVRGARKLDALMAFSRALDEFMNERGLRNDRPRLSLDLAGRVALTRFVARDSEYLLLVPRALLDVDVTATLHFAGKVRVESIVPPRPMDLNAAGSDTAAVVVGPSGPSLLRCCAAK